tara:strand:+ start:2030 stop:2569 length:540 start_codon:yes stop_codon:yes gene_type:complete
VTLQTSGSISISDLVSEFGGSAPHSLSEYLRGGANVPTTITTGVAQGNFSAYQGNVTGATGATGVITSVNYFWKVQFFSSSVVWNGVNKPNTNPAEFSSIISNAGTQTLFLSDDGFEYERGDIIGNFLVPSTSPGFTFSANLYQVRRRQAATETTTTVNTGVPSSGQVSLTDYYGGRKT